MDSSLEALSTFLHCCRARRIDLHGSNCFLHDCRGPRSWIRSFFRNGVSDRALPVTARLHFGSLFHFCQWPQTLTHSPHAKLNSHAHTLPCTFALARPSALALNWPLTKIFLFTWGLSPGVPMATPGTQWSQWGRWPACRQKTRVLTKRSTRLGQRGVSGGSDVPAGSLGSRSVCRSNWPGRGSSLANLLYWRAFLEELSHYEF